MNKKGFFKVLIIPFLIYIVLVGLYILFTIYSEQNRIISDVDHRLVIAASNINTILDSNFFDRASDSGKISEAEHLKNIIKINNF